MSRSINIGKVERPLFVFGGVYSNLEALKAVRLRAEEQGFRPKDVICTGDIVAYCANPVESIDFIEEWGVHCIAGNVELNLRDEADDCGCNFNEGGRCDVLSQKWYPFVKNTITQQNKNFIQDLPEFIDFEFYGQQAKVVHGSFHNTSEFIFHSTSAEVFDRNFTDTGADIIISGHCGIPFVRETSKGLWINAGVIGMPANDGTPRTWCGVLGQAQNKCTFEFQALNYDFHKASKAMIGANLPDTYAKTLITGIWDNCEILPEEETMNQGVKLSW